MSRTASTLGILLAALLFVGLAGPGCRFATPKPGGAAATAALRADLDAALDGRSGGDIIALSESFIAQPDVDARERVWAAGAGLEYAASIGDLEAVMRLLPALDAAIVELVTELPRETDDELLMMRAEAAVHAAHEAAYTRFSGGGGDLARGVMGTSFEVARRHFSDGLRFAELLWTHAEMLRRSGDRDGAIELYDRVAAVDYTGDYRERALQSIIDIRTSASLGSPLPTNTAERMEIPSPHREWIEIARRRIDESPTAADSRQYLVRVAQIQLAYQQIDEGYATLRSVIESADDAASIDAASLLLTHVADSNPSKRAFRTVRKELQANKFLWRDRDFRLLVKRLRKKIEGR